MLNTVIKATRPRRRRTHRRGIALMDVMIGGIMLAIGLGVVLSISSRSLSTQTNGERRLMATWLADELLSMVLVEGPDMYRQSYDTSGWFDEPFEAFQYEVILEEGGQREPFDVTAIVRWDSGGGAMREVRVNTLIARYWGDKLEIREPLEPIDRTDRWFQIQYPEEAADGATP